MKTSLSLILLSIAGLAQEIPPVPPLPPVPPIPHVEVVVPPIPPMPPLPPMPDMEPLFALRDKLQSFEFAQRFAYSGFPGLAFQKRDRDSDRAEEQAEREYERGRRAIDKRQYDEALNRFSEVVAIARSNADAALYWKAYALSRLGRTSEAVTTLDTLAKSHPQSRWLNDAKALQVEARQAAGKPVSPENVADEEIKLMALNSLMESDPERALPLIQKLLETSSSPKLRERALFVVSQNDSPKAREIVVKIAKGSANPDLQMKAIHNLGIYGKNSQLLADVYASSNDVAVKKRVLHSFMVSNERDRLMAVAKSDPSPEMRREAIHWLGTMGANTQLSDLYGTETSVEVRERILQSMFISGNTQKLIEVARTEKDPKLRQRAIQHLGTTNAPGVPDALVAMYGNSPEPEIRKRIIQALFVQGNAKQIVEIARKETNVDLKKHAVQQLSHMDSKDAKDYMMELLK